jgi:hypothetical protein
MSFGRSMMTLSKNRIIKKENLAISIVETEIIALRNFINQLFILRFFKSLHEFINGTFAEDLVKLGPVC